MAGQIDQEEDRRNLTLEALADVDAGRIIGHQAVQVWADSLKTKKPLSAPRGMKMQWIKAIRKAEWFMY